MLNQTLNSPVPQITPHHTVQKSSRPAWEQPMAERTQSLFFCVFFQNYFHPICQLPPSDRPRIALSTSPYLIHIIFFSTYPAPSIVFCLIIAVNSFIFFLCLSFAVLVRSKMTWTAAAALHLDKLIIERW